MYYTIYKTTNKINDKIYVGYHSTKDLNDNYIGSGKALSQAIEKNGRHNFVKEVLYVFPTKREALQKERELVNEQFVQRTDTYNMKVGGEGGWDHTWNDLGRLNAIKIAFKEGRMKGWQQSHEQRSMTGKSSFLGKHHSDASKKKIGEAHKMENDEIQKRIKDFNEIEKKWGYVSKLSERWQISHTQVRRFLKNHSLE